ncbi:MAG: ATP-binding cassette domain-containing protein [Patescibacteria group bacterium]|mgnify:FL=1
MVISVSHLSKYYKTYQKEPGFLESVKSLFSRRFETIPAVDDISFSIGEGELVGFIGPNGAGKTTTLKCLSGLLYPTGGKVSVFGFTPWERKYEFLSQIALVMGQKNQLWWDLPALETFILNKEIYEISTKKFNEKLSELSALLKVDHLLKTPVRKLSLGERMKMELIASLIHSPKVLFLDEPTLGLDVVMQQALRDFIKEYNKSHHATIILTSHYMKDVESLCKRIIIISSGKIIFDGVLSSLIKQHSPYKLIKIILKKEVDESALRALDGVLNFQYPELILTSPNEKISQVTSMLLKQFTIEDLTIQDPPIEDIIRQIFNRNQ